MGKKIFVLSLLGLLLAGWILSVPMALAEDENGTDGGSSNSALFDKIKDDQLTPLANTDLPGSQDKENYNLLGEIAKIIKVALGTLVMVFMVLLIYAGFSWMTSGGNEETINKAKKMIAAALIGLVVVFFAYAITVLVFNLILNNKLA